MDFEPAGGRYYEIMKIFSFHTFSLDEKVCKKSRRNDCRRALDFSRRANEVKILRLGDIVKKRRI